MLTPGTIIPFTLLSSWEFWPSYLTYWGKITVACSVNPTTLPPCALLQIAVGPPTALFPNLMLLCKRFHSISVLTANFQAASDTFPHPLNHLTAIFFKTSTFCLLPIYHPPFLHLSFFTHFHLPRAFRQPWRWWLLLQPLPTFPSVRLLWHFSLSHFANSCWGRTQPSSSHLVPVSFSKGQQFTQHHCLLNWFNAIPLNSLEIPGIWSHCSPAWFRKALLNYTLPWTSQGFCC